ncbi:glutamate-5-semialdehyde dehydrogenase [Candidatus Palauibacter sp.]|uniref:glutamate-5-semialdehyde dehydrogenase n=1 Tax=Candidatus Palauibacter sp. TaxID=3101350 RepID=UPI003AF25A30
MAPMATPMAENLRVRTAAVREAQRVLGSAPAERRTAALRALKDVLLRSRAEISRANEADLSLAAEEGLSGPLLHRLGLSDAKFESLLEGVDALADGEDPIDQVLSRTELDEGLVLESVRSPLGVLLIIFESRPDAVIQIGSLAIRSGNGVIMKGGREAAHSNVVLVDCLRRALEGVGLNPRAVLGVPDRRDVDELLALDDLIDLVIPRGSGALVRSIQERSRIPVLGHAEGVCHLYVDASADPDMAVRLAVDGKCDYPAACNATETLLVHASFLPRLPGIGDALRERGVELRCDERALRALPWAEAASEQDWGQEFGALTLAVRTVESLEEAVDHIHRYGSSHTDAIVAEDRETGERFLKEVDAASVFHNASTRFADGFRYGLGAEVGISTARIHARGPVGVEGLLTTRWLLRGEGQGAADYGPGRRSFTHRPLDG